MTVERSELTSNDNENCVPMIVQWDLLDAAISAVCDNGEIYNERGVNLSVHEGRSQHFHSVGEWNDLDDEPVFREALRYELSWIVKDSSPPDSGQQTEGHVGVFGKLADGRICKIVGKGFIGRDSLGQIEGTFYSPPKIEVAQAEEAMVDID